MENYKANKYNYMAIFSVSLFLFACENSERNEDESKQSSKQYLEIGDSISILAQQTLLKNVAVAMQNGGSYNAVDFCNIHASKIMDSLSQSHQVSINRISLKYRNPNNKPSAFEKQLLKEMAVSKKMDTLLKIGNKNTYYKSILIGIPTCLKCHGTESDIDSKTNQLINERYPKDLAKGYKLGDFRGAWKIEFSE